MPSWLWSYYVLAGALALSALVLWIVGRRHDANLKKMTASGSWMAFFLIFLTCVRHEGGERFIPHYSVIYLIGLSTGALGAYAASLMGERFSRFWPNALWIGALIALVWAMVTAILTGFIVSGVDGALGFGFYSLPVAGIFVVPYGALLELAVFVCCLRPMA